MPKFFEQNERNLSITQICSRVKANCGQNNWSRKCVLWITNERPWDKRASTPLPQFWARYSVRLWHKLCLTLKFQNGRRSPATFDNAPAPASVQRTLRLLSQKAWTVFRRRIEMVATIKRSQTGLRPINRHRKRFDSKQTRNFGFAKSCGGYQERAGPREKDQLEITDWKWQTQGNRITSIEVLGVNSFSCFTWNIELPIIHVFSKVLHCHWSQPLHLGKQS